eukprot:1238947-Amphidinium_carterae.1
MLTGSSAKDNPVTRISNPNTSQGTGSWLLVYFPPEGGYGTSGKAQASTLGQQGVLDIPNCHSRCTAQEALVHSQIDGTRCTTPLVWEKAPYRGPWPNPNSYSIGSTTLHKGWAARLAH